MSEIEHLHSLLRRQLRRTMGTLASIPPEWQPLIAAVDEAYRQSDVDRGMLERSLDLSSQELLQANSDMRAVFQAFPDVLFRLDRDDTIVEVKAGREPDRDLLTGDPIGRPIADILPATITTAIARVRATGAIESVEFELASSAPRAAYEARIIRLLADQLIVIVRNITDRKQAEDALQAKTRQFQATLAHLNQIVSSSLDTGAVLRQIVSAAAAILGIRTVSLWVVDEAARTVSIAAISDDVIARDFPLRTVAFGEGVPGWVAAHRRPLEVPDVSVDPRITALDWWRRHGLTSYYGVPVVLGDTVLAVMALYTSRPFALDRDDHELLESFAAQAALAIRNARLFEESQARRRAAEELADLNRVISQSLDIEEVPRRVAASARTLLDAQCAMLYRVDPASGDLVTAAVAGEAGGWNPGAIIPAGHAAAGLALRQRGPVIAENVLTDPRILLTPDVRARIEASRYRAVLAVPLVMHDRVIGVLGLGAREGRVFRDAEMRQVQTIAAHAALALENARLYAEAKELILRLEEAGRAKSRFLANMSHELRTPLNSIIGFSQVLLKGLEGELNERQSAYISTVHNSSRHLLQLINEVLDISRIEAGRLELVRESVDLAALIDECVDATQALCAGKQLVIERDVVLDVKHLDADRTKLKQVLLNLLSNAIKFTPRGTVIVRARSDQSVVRVSVADQGIGIPADDLPRIFEPFHRASRSSALNAGGAGLGLSISRKFVELHGGQILVDSEERRGSTFHVLLPVGAGAPRA